MQEEKSEGARQSGPTTSLNILKRERLFPIMVADSRTNAGVWFPRLGRRGERGLQNRLIKNHFIGSARYDKWVGVTKSSGSVSGKIRVYAEVLRARAEGGRRGRGDRRSTNFGHKEKLGRDQMG